MTLKMIRLTYKGHGVFTTRQKLPLSKGQSVRAYLGPTPITDATRGLFKISPRLAKRLIDDPELDVLNS